jgi:hypothetical protein
MKINIPDKTDKDDRKILELLELNPYFEKRILETRQLFGIPLGGIDEDSIFFHNSCLCDDKGSKVKLVRFFPEDNSDKSFHYFDKFLDDPDRFFSLKGEFRKKIQKIISRFNLTPRWYHAVCHIVLFSKANWLTFSIEAEVQHIRQKSVWEKSGIVIRVTKDITKKQFVKWVNENWDEFRIRLNESLNITKQRNIPEDKYFYITKEIIELRNKNMPFDKITDSLGEKYEREMEDDKQLSKILVSQKAIENRYYRYLKLLGSIPRKRATL